MLLDGKVALVTGASRGVTGNMVAPGCCDTDMTAVLSDKVKYARVQ